MEDYASNIEDLPIKKQDLTQTYQKRAWFTTYKNGEIFPYYKEDMKRIINPFKPSTFFPFLKALDIPFFEQEWLNMLNYYIENGKLDLSCIFFKYCILYSKNYTFKDTNKIFNSKEEYDTFCYTINKKGE